MTCSEIQQLVPPGVPCDYAKFTNLPKSTKTMLNDWFEYTWKIREAPIEEHPRGMLQAWALLGFVGQVTTGSADQNTWLPALLYNADLDAIFSGVMENPKSLLRMYVKRLMQVWPVYSSVELAEAGIQPSTAVTRVEVIEEYANHTVLHPVPGCLTLHAVDGSLPLPDWQHTLLTWKRVFDNCLDPRGFHPTEMELRIVTAAFMSFVYFYKEGKVFFETPSMRPDLFDRTQIFSSL
jgi:hypothetical protein